MAREFPELPDLNNSISNADGVHGDLFFGHVDTFWFDYFLCFKRKYFKGELFFISYCTRTGSQGEDVVLVYVVFI